VKTGQILACANYPTYDPADYYEKYDELLEAEFSPLTNRALQTIYPPGSAYKMVPSIAALESKAITPETRIYDNGVFDKYSCLTLYCLAHTSYGVSHGNINVAEALMYSCNYFYYSLGELVSIEKVDYVAKQLGLGEPTGVELPESVGYRANEETKKELYSGTDRVWVMGDQLPAMIGQSDNRFTPLQLAVYTAAIANKGVRYKATFMNRVVSTDYQELLAENKPTVAAKLEMKESTIDAIFEGMHWVTWSRTGTAYNGGAWRYMPVNAAGKTSTAQQYWGASDNGAFVCFAPLEDPEIAIAVYVEKAGHGSTLASIAKNMLDVYFDVDEVGDVVSFENQLS
jgi:penicillin-binding protein 2